MADAANRINAREQWVGGRLNVVTEMSSGELSVSENFRSSVRAHCFFSARVAEARIIERLRTVSDEYTLGRLDRATARWRLKEFLDSTPRSGGADGAGLVVANPLLDTSLRNLASTARLDLILTQNKAMAEAAGKRSEILRLGAPLQRYVPSWKREKRDSHKQWYHIVLPATDPFWATHTPPLDFNCGCSIEAVWDEEDAAEFGGVSRAELSDEAAGDWTITTPEGRKIVVPRSASGYEFDVDSAFGACDLSRVNDVPLRRAALEEIRKETRKGQLQFDCIPSAAPETVPPLGTASMPAAVEAFVEKQVSHFRQTGAWLDEEAPLGAVTESLRDALGIAGRGRVVLAAGSSRHGLQHMADGHQDELENGDFVRALQDTLYGEGVRVALRLRGGDVSMAVVNAETSAYTTLDRFGQNDDWRVVSAFYGD